MESPDNRMYLCSQCFKRCPWSDLSKKEHRCSRCRLPDTSCVICDRIFEPWQESLDHCKRCDFYLLKHAAVKPPPVLDKPEAGTYGDNIRDGCSVTERWQEIKSAAGISDDVYFSD
ncbi:hypothetical protein KR009_000884 [Drosophila setifemur]|nr:hypothetical protein KR009_001964 [Drosophila setifemur]KAH8413884.1 hypothetical protein KR009_000884 [Drosophila setifemur]